MRAIIFSLLWASCLFQSTVFARSEAITIETYRQAEATTGNPESELYDEEAFCNILQQALKADILGEADKMRARYRLEIAAKNRPGTTTADFKFIARNGKTESLLSLQADKPILLLFYDPDCDHCMQTIADLKKKEISKKTKVVAIYAEDDRDRWEETNEALPQDWTVGFSLDPIQDDETYVFITSPTVYLLDSDKKVLLKDTNIDLVEKKLR
ncbi:MAG: hypothetical protein K2K95_03495 [Muribaculaceae bacterium]|nr:hypothetical protein [Muribaculaceae bacterium]